MRNLLCERVQLVSQLLFCYPALKRFLAVDHDAECGHHLVLLRILRLLGQEEVKEYEPEVDEEEEMPTEVAVTGEAPSEEITRDSKNQATSKRRKPKKQSRKRRLANT